MTRVRTRPSVQRPTHVITYTVVFEQREPLTVAVPSIADLVSAILRHARRWYGTVRPLYAVIEPGGAYGYLWSGRQVIDMYQITAGAR